MRRTLNWFVPILLISAIVACSPAKTADTCYESVFLPGEEAVRKVYWNHDGTKLAVVLWPRIEIWERNTCEWQLANTIEEAYVYSADWHPNQDILAGVRGGLEENLMVWDAGTGEALYSLTRPRPPGQLGILVLRDLAWTPDGGSIVSDSALWNDAFLLWDLAEGAIPQALISRLPPEPHHVSFELELSPNGTLLLSSGTDDRRAVTHVWSIETGAALATVRGTGPVAWGPTGDRFAGVDDGYLIHIWQLETNSIIATFDKHSEPIASISWNMNIPLVASADRGDNLKIWNANTGIEYHLDDIELTGLNSVAWSPQGTELAVGGDQGVLILNFDPSFVKHR